MCGSAVMTTRKQQQQSYKHCIIFQYLLVHIFIYSCLTAYNLCTARQTYNLCTKVSNSLGICSVLKEEVRNLIFFMQTANIRLERYPGKLMVVLRQY